jgi:oxygen-independent coproporphyrinogen-3 oxidase
VDSIYFGGGTPSLMPSEHMLDILNACRDAFALARDCEISLEANPDTLQPENTGLYKQMGVNRISIGAQSFHDAELRGIGRIHNSGAVEKSVCLLKERGFININLDLLLGLPGQTAGSWTRSIDRMAEMKVAHVSVYMLDLDEPCPLSESVAGGSVTIPDDEWMAERYLETIEKLDSYGYSQYEISNFARRGFECRHNLKYWLREPVLGFGLASHSFDGSARYANFADMGDYLESLASGRQPVEWRRPVPINQALEEIMFLGLRLNRGIRWDRLQRDYGSARLEQYGRTLKDLCREGFVDWTGTRVRLTSAGMLLSNEIFQQFL